MLVVIYVYMHMHLKSLLCKAGAGRMTRFSVIAIRSHCNMFWISFQKIPCPQPLTVPKLLDGLGIVEMVDHWTTGWIWNGPKQPHCLGTAGWMLTYHSISTNRASTIAKSFEVLNSHKDHLFWSGLNSHYFICLSLILSLIRPSTLGEVLSMCLV